MFHNINTCLLAYHARYYLINNDPEAVAKSPDARQQLEPKMPSYIFCIQCDLSLPCRLGYTEIGGVASSTLEPLCD